MIFLDFNTAVIKESNLFLSLDGRLGDKVQKVDIEIDKQLVNVQTDLSREEIFEVIKKTGKTVTNVE
uniref:HMA domain-containing protein n=1 Tax=Ditylenchus dipsaci TaxID=166011 RepID=A0A915CNX4_9BILA